MSKGSDPSHVAEILAKDDGTPTSGNGAADGASGRMREITFRGFRELMERRNHDVDGLVDFFLTSATSVIHVWQVGIVENACRITR